MQSGDGGYWWCMWAGIFEKNIFTINKNGEMVSLSYIFFFQENVRICLIKKHKIVNKVKIENPLFKQFRQKPWRKPFSTKIENGNSNDYIAKAKEEKKL